MKVIGLMGTIGAGKGTVADYLMGKYGFKSITMGDLVREEAEKIGLEKNRENLSKISLEKMEKFGKDYFIKKAIEKIKKEKWERAIIDGVRNPLEVIVFKKEFGGNMKFILVDAKPELRFERMKIRARVGFPKTVEEFQKEEQNEWKQFRLNETFLGAEIIINNDSDLESLHKQVEKAMSEFLK